MFSSQAGARKDPVGSLDYLGVKFNRALYRKKRRISRTGLIKFHFDAYNHASSKAMVLTVLRFIKETPKHCQSKIFVMDIRNKILFIHEYNNQVAKLSIGGKYPKTEPFIELLVKYVELEQELVLREPALEKKRQFLLERLLKSIFFDVFRFNVPDLDSQKWNFMSIEHCLKVLIMVRPEYKKENMMLDKLATSLIGPLSRENGQSPRTMLRNLSNQEMKSEVFVKAEHCPEVKLELKPVKKEEIVQKVSCDSVIILSDSEDENPVKNVIPVPKNSSAHTNSQSALALPKKQTKKVPQVKHQFVVRKESGDEDSDVELVLIEVNNSQMETLLKQKIVGDSTAKNPVKTEHITFCDLTYSDDEEDQKSSVKIETSPSDSLVPLMSQCLSNSFVQSVKVEENLVPYEKFPQTRSLVKQEPQTIIQDRVKLEPLDWRNQTQNSKLFNDLSVGENSAIQKMPEAVVSTDNTQRLSVELPIENTAIDNVQFKSIRNNLEIRELENLSVEHRKLSMEQPQNAKSQLNDSQNVQNEENLSTEHEKLSMELHKLSAEQPQNTKLQLKDSQNIKDLVNLPVEHHSLSVEQPENSKSQLYENQNGENMPMEHHKLSMEQPQNTKSQLNDSHNVKDLVNLPVEQPQNTKSLLNDSHNVKNLENLPVKHERLSMELLKLSMKDRKFSVEQPKNSEEQLNDSQNVKNLESLPVKPERLSMEHRKQSMEQPKNSKSQLNDSQNVKNLENFPMEHHKLSMEQPQNSESQLNVSQNVKNLENFPMEHHKLSMEQPQNSESQLNVSQNIKNLAEHRKLSGEQPENSKSQVYDNQNAQNRENMPMEHERLSMELHKLSMEQPENNKSQPYDSHNVKNLEHFPVEHERLCKNSKSQLNYSHNVKNVTNLPVKSERLSIEHPQNSELQFNDCQNAQNEDSLPVEHERLSMEQPKNSKSQLTDNHHVKNITNLPVKSERLSMEHRKLSIEQPQNSELQFNDCQNAQNKDNLPVKHERLSMEQPQNGKSQFTDCQDVKNQENLPMEYERLSMEHHNLPREQPQNNKSQLSNSQNAENEDNMLMERDRLSVEPKDLCDNKNIGIQENLFVKQSKPHIEKPMESQLQFCNSKNTTNKEILSMEPSKFHLENTEKLMECSIEFHNSENLSVEHQKLSMELSKFHLTNTEKCMESNTNNENVRNLEKLSVESSKFPLENTETPTKCRTEFFNSENLSVENIEKPMESSINYENVKKLEKLSVEHDNLSMEPSKFPLENTVKPMKCSTESYNSENLSVENTEKPMESSINYENVKKIDKFSMEPLEFPLENTANRTEFHSANLSVEHQNLSMELSKFHLTNTEKSVESGTNHEQVRKLENLSMEPSKFVLENIEKPLECMTQLCTQKNVENSSVEEICNSQNIENSSVEFQKLSMEQSKFEPECETQLYNSKNNEKQQDLSVEQSMGDETELNNIENIEKQDHSNNIIINLPVEKQELESLNTENFRECEETQLSDNQVNRNEENMSLEQHCDDKKLSVESLSAEQPDFETVDTEKPMELKEEICDSQIMINEENLSVEQSQFVQLNSSTENVENRQEFIEENARIQNIELCNEEDLPVEDLVNDEERESMEQLNCEIGIQQELSVECEEKIENQGYLSVEQSDFVVENIENIVEQCNEEKLSLENPVNKEHQECLSVEQSPIEQLYCESEESVGNQNLLSVEQSDFVVENTENIVEQCNEEKLSVENPVNDEDQEQSPIERFGIHSNSKELSVEYEENQDYLSVENTENIVEQCNEEKLSVENSVNGEDQECLSAEQSPIERLKCEIVTQHCNSQEFSVECEENVENPNCLFVEQSDFDVENMEESSLENPENDDNQKCLSVEQPDFIVENTENVVELCNKENESVENPINDEDQECLSVEQSDFVVENTENIVEQCNEENLSDENLVNEEDHECLSVEQSPMKRLNCEIVTQHCTSQELSLECEENVGNHDCLSVEQSEFEVENTENDVEQCNEEKWSVENPVNDEDQECLSVEQLNCEVVTQHCNSQENLENQGFLSVEQSNFELGNTKNVELCNEENLSVNQEHQYTNIENIDEDFSTDYPETGEIVVPATPETSFNCEQSQTEIVVEQSTTEDLEALAVELHDLLQKSTIEEISEDQALTEEYYDLDVTEEIVGSPNEANEEVVMEPIIEQQAKIEHEVVAEDKIVRLHCSLPKIVMAKMKTERKGVINYGNVIIRDTISTNIPLIVHQKVTKKENYSKHRKSEEGKNLDKRKKDQPINSQSRMKVNEVVKKTPKYFLDEEIRKDNEVIKSVSKKDRRPEERKRRTSEREIEEENTKRRKSDCEISAKVLSVDSLKQKLKIKIDNSPVKEDREKRRRHKHKKSRKKSSRDKSRSRISEEVQSDVISSTGEASLGIEVKEQNEEIFNYQDPGTPLRDEPQYQEYNFPNHNQQTSTVNLRDLWSSSEIITQQQIFNSLNSQSYLKQCVSPRDMQVKDVQAEQNQQNGLVFSYNSLPPEGAQGEGLSMFFQELSPSKMYFRSESGDVNRPMNATQEVRIADTRESAYSNTGDPLLAGGSDVPNEIPDLDDISYAVNSILQISKSTCGYSDDNYLDHLLEGTLSTKTNMSGTMEPRDLLLDNVLTSKEQDFLSDSNLKDLSRQNLETDLTSLSSWSADYLSPILDLPDSEPPSYSLNEKNSTGQKRSSLDEPMGKPAKKVPPKVSPMPPSKASAVEIPCRRRNWTKPIAPKKNPENPPKKFEDMYNNVKLRKRIGKTNVNDELLIDSLLKENERAQRINSARKQKLIKATKKTDSGALFDALKRSTSTVNGQCSSSKPRR